MGVKLSIEQSLTFQLLLIVKLEFVISIGLALFLVKSWINWCLTRIYSFNSPYFYSFNLKRPEIVLTLVKYIFYVSDIQDNFLPFFPFDAYRICTQPLPAFCIFHLLLSFFFSCTKVVTQFGIESLQFFPYNFTIALKICPWATQQIF